jgi:two-component system, LytTR family, response regulator
MITCFAVDDEPHALRQVEDYVNQISFLQWLGGTTQSVSAMEQILQLQPQLIFLDINMPGLNGLDLLQLINTKTSARVILTTGNDKHGIAGYNNDVIDYLLKPYDLPRFLRASHKAFALLQPDIAGKEVPNGKIIVKASGKHYVELAQIDYVESDRNYVYIHTGKEKIMVADTLKNLEELLPGEFFIRIHKSFIVAYKKVKLVQGDTLLMRNNTSLPIGKMYKEDFYHLMGLKQQP